MARRTSIAARLFLLVFGFSVAWFTLTTASQMLLEYSSTRAEVDASLVDLFRASQSGLDSALWNYDGVLVRKVMESTRSVQFLSGAKARDDMGTVLGSWGDPVPGSDSPVLEDWSNVLVLTQPLSHRFVVRHSDSKGRAVAIGELDLVSDLGVLANRLADRFRLIVINYLANTLGLMVILLLGLRALVSRPLGRITRAIGGYRFDRSSLPLQDRTLTSENELAVLWRSFETLTMSLKEAYLQQRAMSAILEEAAVMALVGDSDGRVVWANAQARLWLSGAEAGGVLAGLTYGTGGIPLFQGVSELLAEGKAWRGELSVQNAQGRIFWFSAALLPLEVPDEPRARWGVMIEDISAKKLTDLYRQERDLARESARAKSLFLANLSHEIRTPMNAVVGLTALALGEEISPRAREFLADLERSGAALLGVINDILDYSKLDEGKMDLEVLDFSLDDLLRGVEAMARFRAEEKGLEFRVTAGPGIAPILRGDRLRLQQVLINLVTNAVKFTDRGGVEVTVRLLAGDGSGKVRDGAAALRFEVRDTGIGIDPVDQPRLFRSFSQVDASTTRKYGGTGLGLAITRQLVHLMGGSVGFESAPGKGSLFWFDVTLEQGSHTTPAPAPSWNFAGLRVLLAEDNKVNQLVAKEILHKVGILPVVVSNGQQAVEAAASGAFDLVLMDLQMPVMDGLEATKAIRKTRDAGVLPILAMTAHTFAQERETCLAAGMQDLVPKPVDPGVLYRAISLWRPQASRS